MTASSLNYLLWGPEDPQTGQTIEMDRGAHRWRYGWVELEGVRGQRGWCRGPVTWAPQNTLEDAGGHGDTFQRLTGEWGQSLPQRKQMAVFSQGLRPLCHPGGRLETYNPDPT